MQDGSRSESRTAAAVATVIDRIGQRADAVIGATQQHLAAEIMELRGDAQLLDLLRASVAGNVETIFDALRYNIDIERVEPPTAALEYARRVAQHGIPANALIRAYRLGQQEVLRHVLDEIRRADLDPETALDAFDVISTVTFGYIDWISQQVVGAYETERERWLENRNTIRAVKVRELLSGADETADLGAASAALRYPLQRHHLAMILWIGEGEPAGGELLRLEKFVRDLVTFLELREPALFLAVDRVSGWGWLPLLSPNNTVVEDLRRFALAYDKPPHLALGLVATGLAGFRRSHRYALSARRVAVAADRRFVAASDSGLAAAALLSEDLVQTREWVAETLGPLAADTDGDARLRDTLRVFLRDGSSYKAAAEHLNLHHNSIKYRVQRAIERRGRPIAEDRLDVELALLACYWFGDAVLIEPAYTQATAVE